MDAFALPPTSEESLKQRMLRVEQKNYEETWDYLVHYDDREEEHLDPSAQRSELLNIQSAKVFVFGLLDNVQDWMIKGNPMLVKRIIKAAPAVEKKPDQNSQQRLSNMEKRLLGSFRAETLESSSLMVPRNTRKSIIRPGGADFLALLMKKDPPKPAPPREDFF